jgi:hypothetical protein
VTVLGVLCDACYGDKIRTTVYEYGCGDEFYGGYDGVEVAVNQLRAANRLWNALVEIDHQDRIAYRSLTTDPDIEKELAAKNVELDAINAQSCISTSSDAGGALVYRQPPEPPVEKIVLATAILKISNAVEELRRSGLNEKGVIVLLSDRSGYGKGLCRDLLRSLAELQKVYCR